MRTYEQVVHDYITDNSIATDKEIKLVTCINGYNLEALNNIIYAKTGYHDLKQHLECEGGIL